MSETDRWNRVKEVFAEALERSGGERDSYIREACGTDEELREEVISLLAAHDTVDDFIARPAAQQAGLVIEKPAKEWIGERLGHYRIVAEAGRGGMSQVFKAVRDDQQYEKQVAIKLLKPGLDTESVLRKFKAERQILAQLSHPNIAHLLDGGATDDGAPYLVMEYIDGKPIDQYCDEHQLDLNDRIDLFRQLCSAVHYVHQHLMVHGDLKGGNVLVTNQGVVKLLDFGIAKLLQPNASTREERATTFLALTPEYASPEQVRGEAITTSSDVYSLGVMLYRLLSGQLPYKVSGSSTWEIATQICNDDPLPPSVRAEQAGIAHSRFAKSISGDLDNIVLKAMKKAPEERYGSAEQMAEDLRRYLRGFPVEARPDTTRYRVRKFVQRHRTAAVAASLLFVAIVGGIITTTWQASVAKAERARATRHLNEVRELTNVFLADVYNAMAKLPGGTAARQLIVENSVKYLSGMEREAQDSPEFQRDLAQAYDRLADVQGDYIGANLGDTQAAVKSLRRALKLRQAAAEHAPSLESNRDLLRSYVKLSELLTGQSRMVEAIPLARAGVQVADLVLKDPRATLLERQYAAAAYMTLGWEHGLMGDGEAATGPLFKARELYQAVARERPDDPDSQRGLMLIAARIGDVYMAGLHQPDKALPLYEEAVALIEPMIAKDPLNAELQRAKAFALTTIGDAHNDLGDANRALQNHERALAIVEQLRAADSADHLAPLAVAYILNGRGKSYFLLGQHELALHDFSRAETILRGAPPATANDIAEVRLLPGITYANLARVEATMSRQATLTPVLRKNYVREARDWSQRARRVLEPMTTDLTEGRRAKRILSDVDALAPLLEQEAT
ncbi:MAG TPA: protein kinase [Steroidobacteraceae bacterium]|nr:protein kinase [Steroidobacteraceae bacterium]